MLDLAKHFSAAASDVDQVALSSTVEEDRCLMIIVGLLTAYVILRTTVVPVLQLSYFADDFAFLNWTSRLNMTSWLAGFLEPGHFNLTYRPLAAVIYLVYLTGSATFCYFLLASLFAINIVVLFFLYRRLSNFPIAGLSVIIFAASFIFFDAAHKVYNLITQASTICFLTSLHYFLSSADSSPKARTSKFLAYFFYALSLLTYEITLFGFVIFFVLALWRKYSTATTQVRLNAVFIKAVKASWVFAALSAVYLMANLLSPIKAAHVRDHAIPLSLFTVSMIATRAWEVLKNTLAWIIAPISSEKVWRISSIEFLLLSLLLAIIISLLLVRSADLEVRRQAKSRAFSMFWMALFGGLWFIVFLLPGASSSYFDYRMTFLAYAGFSLAVAACLSLIYGALCNGLTGDSPLAQWTIAGTFGLIVTIWLISNLSLTETMNKSLVGAGNQQRQILTLLRPYLPALPEDSVLVVRYAHSPSRTLPYPYIGSPFAEDYALADAVEYYLGRRVPDASLFFRPDPHQFEIGRFAFARKVYPYDRLALFDFVDNQLTLKSAIKVGDEEMFLPLAANVAGRILQ